jgi:hypothetical protein
LRFQGFWLFSVHNFSPVPVYCLFSLRVYHQGSTNNNFNAKLAERLFSHKIIITLALTKYIQVYVNSIGDKSGARGGTKQFKELVFAEIMYAPSRSNQTRTN